MKIGNENIERNTSKGWGVRKRMTAQERGCSLYGKKMLRERGGVTMTVEEREQLEFLKKIQKGEYQRRARDEKG